MTLTDAKINTDYVITNVKECGIKRRLLDLGFTPGSLVTVKSAAPKGETLLIRLRGVDVALRKSATDYISVEVKSESHVCACRKS